MKWLVAAKSEDWHICRNDNAKESSSVGAEYAAPLVAVCKDLEFGLGLWFYKDAAPTALWAAATCRRFESADMTAHSKTGGKCDVVVTKWNKMMAGV